MKVEHGALRWFARPTFNMLSGEPKLYRRFSDGMLVEAGHFLLRKRSLVRFFGGHIVALDPRTPAFQTPQLMAVDQRTEKIRTSYMKLAVCHGDPIWKRFSHLEPVKRTDFTQSSCRSVASNLLDLQETCDPGIILPPYFAFHDPLDPWIEVNIRLFDSTCDQAEDIDVYLPVAFDHQLLRMKDELEAICDLLLDIHAEGYAIWPVGLNETHATAKDLEGLAMLMGRLPKETMLLYGGYFSMLLCSVKGSSFSNGPCFYERRDLNIAPRLEFRPRCRYYLPALHQKVDPVTAVVFYRLLDEVGMVPALCPACRRNVDGAEYDAIAEMPDLDVFEHNLLIRRREMDSLDSSADPIKTAAEGLRGLLAQKDHFSQFYSLKYAETWLMALENISS